ncbi:MULTISPECIES: peptidoglycan -binding protein [Paracoccus]|uniref:Chemotaxis protein MotB n=1 Tax=Paracoccus versutus TaxID=34007 RepID=A0A369TWY4_PARVE|nr:MULTISPECIES: peptidoglycan -binding protein [Paracoccus]SFY42770.1 chemotaxis protein MotB [Paracoccus pantotrophus]MCJ1901532.1 peptidoglycan -binding protein [Paracoccus versutus]MDF3905474.1 peptidoglycan -binding protein [Paracoccus sp. AS002]RDD69799.1 peptidoglycan -binding protein [Paracoccus versutus]REF68993.1 chemotaxis protein MotB [Paracoccus versutus]
MGLSRGGGNRFSATIWPGFVDAMTALLMVMMFVLTIFLLVQSVLRDQITTQDSELDQLGRQVAELSDALSTSQAQAASLDRDLAAERDRLRRSEQAVASARAEIDAQTEAARLAAARREALEALIGDLRRQNTETRQQLDETEAARLADAAAAEALRERLARSDAELDAATLELEAARKEAEETLTLLAAAEAAKKQLGEQAEAQASEAEKQAALLALARQELSEQEALTVEDQRRLAALNQQVARLNDQLGSLRAVLDAAGDERREADLRAEDLGRQLNVALLRAAEEERKRRALEEDARSKAEAEAKDLARYRSEFFGRLSQILAGREGVQVVGDRFVFSSEVLFAPGEATLSPEGQAQIARVAEMLGQISAEIPPEIGWMIRVDGHTDDVPLSGLGRYRDNWELSQARALAVVRYMVDDLGFPATRLAPAGFADTRPVAQGDTPEARARNRRIELKLTER